MSARLGKLDTSQATILANEGNMQTYMHCISDRVDEFSDDVERLGQPYDFAYRGHMVPQTMVTPSKYERP